MVQKMGQGMGQMGLDSWIKHTGYTDCMAYVILPVLILIAF